MNNIPRVEKKKFVESDLAGGIIGFMILGSWLSFLVSIWSSFLGYYPANGLYYGFFWLITTIILASLLGAKRKG